MANKEIKDIVLNHKSGLASAVISTFGAHIINWKIYNQDMLFMSKKAVMDGSRPIRGGIPICFPQFGPGKLQQHGFARNVVWEFVNTEDDEESGDVFATFRLVSNDETHAMWPHDFELQYTVALGSCNLRMELKVTNTGSTPFDYQSLLHTYFKTENSIVTTVHGLKGLDYIDSADHRTVKTEREEVVTFNGGYVDRIYKRDVHDEVANRSKAEALLAIGDGGNCDLVIRAANYKDAVVWNPGADKCAAMDDMHEHAWTEFVCCEVGNVVKSHTIQPGESNNFGQSIVLRILAVGAAAARRAVAEETLKKQPPRQSLDPIAPAKKEEPETATIEVIEEENA